MKILPVLAGGYREPVRGRDDVMTERENLQRTIPFATGTAMTGAVLTMILPPKGGPARTAGGRGNP